MLTAMKKGLPVGLGLPEMMKNQEHVDTSAVQDVLGAVEPHLVSSFCLVASWSMAIGSYSKLLKGLLQKHNGYLCKVLKTGAFKCERICDCERIISSLLVAEVHSSCRKLMLASSPLRFRTGKRLCYGLCT